MDKDLNYLNELTWAYRASRILQVAVKLQIFTHLSSEPKTCPQLALLTAAKPDLLDKVLIASASLGLLHKKGDQYCNAPLAEEYLIPEKPLYQGDIILHGSSVWEFWDTLPTAVFREPPECEEMLY